jgi:hypothetical protein
MPTKFIRLAAPALALALAVLAGCDTSDPVDVRLTITGPDGVIFDDEVTTAGGTVTPLTEDSHTCDGTNNSANPEPGATPTSTLDDAASGSSLTWDGIWYASFDDYLVTEIDGITQTADEFWLISVNGQPTPVGGCQFIVDPGDQVEFTWTEID